MTRDGAGDAGDGMRLRGGRAVRLKERMRGYVD